MKYSSPYDFVAFARLGGFRIYVITGACRSGKTTVGKIIGSMENVEHLDEPWLPMMLPVMEHLGMIDTDVAVRTLRAFTEELFNDVVLLRSANFRNTDTSSIFDVKDKKEINKRLTTLHSRSDVAEYVKRKHSTLLYNLAETIPFCEFLRKAFPECKIIHVLRDGVILAGEIARKSWFSNDQLIKPLNNILYYPYRDSKSKKKLHIPWWVPEDKVDRFLSMSDLGRSLFYWRRLLGMSWAALERLKRSNPDSYCEVRYEQAIADPERLVRHMEKFLGLKRTSKTDRLVDELQYRPREKRDSVALGNVTWNEIGDTNRVLARYGYKKVEDNR